MAERSVTVRLKAEIAGFKAAMAEAGRASQAAAVQSGQAFESTGSKAGDMVKKSQAYSDSWNTVANAATIGGAAVVAGVGATVKAAASWETAWTGVKKTVDGTPQQLAAVESGLRGLAKQLPASHAEIAGVAEAAGQLGVKTSDVVAFTKTMIDMGESTNMTADEAATSIARFTNIMGTVGEVGSSAYSRVGSAMVALGNNFATTEREITEMGLRLAGTGRQIGLTEGDVLGLAAAMSSVGIEAEAGGTAMSTALKKIDAAVRDGSSNLATFAEVSGKSAREFTELWRANPSQALDEFVQGLARVQESGGSVSQVLSDLGIKGIREQDTFLRLAGASDILSEALRTGNQAFQENSALAEEAQKRYATDASRIRIAWNTIKNTMIDAGSVVLPMVANIADGVSGLIGALDKIPAPVLGITTAIAGIAGVGLLAVGGMMKLITVAADLRGALDTLGISADGVGGKLGRFARGATIIGLAVGIITQTMGTLGRASEKSAIGLESMARVMDSSGGSIDALNQKFREADWVATGDYWRGGIEGINGVGDAISRVANAGAWDELNAGVARFLGYETSFGQMENDIKSLDQALATMVSSGNFEGAAENFRKIAEEAQASGASAEDLVRTFPELSSAVSDYAATLGVTLTPQEKLDAMMGNMPSKLAEAAGGSEQAAAGLEALGESAGNAETKLADVFNVLTKLGLAYQTQEQAIGSYHESLRALGEQAGLVASGQVALGEVMDLQAGQFNVTTEAGLQAFNAFSDLANAGWEAARAMTDNGASQEAVRGQLAATYQSLYGTALQFGLTGDQADELTRKVLGIPQGVDIETWMSDSAKNMAESTDRAVQNIPDSDHVDSSMSDSAKNTADSTKRSVDSIPDSNHTNLTASDSAKKTADSTKSAIDRIPAYKSITIAIKKASDSGKLWKGALPGMFYSGGLVAEGIRGFARGGGLIPGTSPANPTVDNRIGRVMDTGEIIGIRSREYIVNEPAVWRGNNLAWLRFMNSGGTMPAPRGFAAGGMPAPVAVGAGSGSGGSYDDAFSAALDAMSQARFTVNIGGREFYAMMRDTFRTYDRS